MSPKLKPIMNKIEIALEWSLHRRGQACNIIELMDNWAICLEMLEQILGEYYEEHSERG